MGALWTIRRFILQGIVLCWHLREPALPAMITCARLLIMLPAGKLAMYHVLCHNKYFHHCTYYSLLVAARCVLHILLD